MNPNTETEPKTEKFELSLLASFKVIIVEYFLTTTAHALPNIFRTGNIILKIIWLLCFLASASYCMASMSNVLKEYLTYPSYVSTQIIQEVSSQYPAITFCNLKTLNKSKLGDYFKSPPWNVSRSGYGSPFDYIISQQYYTRTFINNDKNLTDKTRKRMGFELKDMLISCFFNYKICKASDFTYFYDPLYGN